jgi:calcium-sensing receptor
VVGALGTVPKKLNDYLKLIGIRNRVETLQKSAILGTARILRKVRLGNLVL